MQTQQFFALSNDEQHNAWHLLSSDEQDAIAAAASVKQLVCGVELEDGRIAQIVLQGEDYWMLADEELCEMELAELVIDAGDYSDEEWLEQGWERISEEEANKLLA
jgi:hypothetical protein